MNVKTLAAEIVAADSGTQTQNVSFLENFCSYCD
jgi:hypothetical protein